MAEQPTAQNKPIFERMARSIMSQFTPEQMLWRYEHGLVLQSIFLLGKRTRQEEFCRYVKKMYDTKITEEGEIHNYRESEFSLAQVNPGKTLFLLYKKYGEEKYRIAIEKLREQLRKQPRTKSGGFWHEKKYPNQIWLDSLYMQGPFFAQYTVEYGNTSNFDDVVNQFVLIESKVRDTESGLLYHGWDESLEEKWANPETGCSPSFWGRAMGWYCMGLVDVLDYIPASDKHFGALKDITIRMVKTLMKFQDGESGLWFQVMDKGGMEKNYTETSASAMFVYFLLKACRLGIVPEYANEEPLECANKAYQGLLKEKVEENSSGEVHLNGTCAVAGLGGDPYRDGSYDYYVSQEQATDDFKGVGPFILAAMEKEGVC